MNLRYKILIDGCESMKRATQNITAFAVMIALLIQPARAIEVGDVFFVSNGTGNTVISIIKGDADSVDRLSLFARIRKLTKAR